MKYNKLKSGELSAEQAKAECKSTSFTDLPFFKSSNNQTEGLDQNNELQQASNFSSNCSTKVETGTVFCPSRGQKLK